SFGSPASGTAGTGVNAAGTASSGTTQNGAAGAGATAGAGTSPNSPNGTASPTGGGGNPQGADGGQPPNAQAGATPGAAGAATGEGTSTQPGAQPAGTDAQGTDAAGSADAMSTPQPITPTDTPTIIGGNIIGVGSKVDARSVIVYEKAKNYRMFEFVWDPSKDATIAGQPGMQTGTGLGNTTNPPVTTPFGQPAGVNTNPGGKPSPGQPGPPSDVPPLDSSPAPNPQP
ncbi:MAG: hypothetical protein M3N22_06785, partial [Acidobacteriota bacterium]|nr:hypothetical protein [Acidobacteriota bacterium]